MAKKDDKKGLVTEELTVHYAPLNTTNEKRRKKKRCRATLTIVINIACCGICTKTRTLIEIKCTEMKL